jgi:hypothetical protein
MQKLLILNDEKYAPPDKLLDEGEPEVPQR